MDKKSSKLEIIKLLQQNNNFKALNKKIEQMKQKETGFPSVFSVQGIKGRTIKSIKKSNGKLIIVTEDFSGVDEVFDLGFVDGVDGVDGINGKDGLTPQKGVDYFTEEDKLEIIKFIQENIKLLKKEINNNLKEIKTQVVKETKIINTKEEINLDVVTQFLEDARKEFEQIKKEKNKHITSLPRSIRTLFRKDAIDISSPSIINLGTNLTATVSGDEITIDVSVVGGGISDGDKGDITVSASGETWTIDNQAVTFAKMQNVATGGILGRYSALSGSIEELTLGNSITLSALGVLDTIQPLGTDAEVTFSTLTLDSLSNSLPGIAYFDATGKIDTWDQTTYPSLDELSRVKGVTGAIQTQLNAITSDLSALANGMVYKGDWDASAGTFPGGGVAQTGWFYYVSVGGTVGGIEFTAGDNIVATTDNASTTTYASNWSKHDQTDAVTAVVGLVGSISKANLLTALNVEDGADVTDTANVTSAGALMDSEVTSLTTIKTLTFGTGVATALGVNIGSDGAVVLFNGALGTATATSLTSTGNIEIDGTGNAFMILDRNATSNFAAFQFQTNNTTQATIGMYNDASTDLVIQKDNADAGRRQMVVFKANSETVFNEEGGDHNFRVEGDTNANLLFADAGLDRIGIGTGTPSALLHINGATMTTTLELGHATDTTISRVSAGRIAVEGFNVILDSDNADVTATNTGTSTTVFVTPDALAGSYAGRKICTSIVVDLSTNVSTGDGKIYIPTPAEVNGMNLISAHAFVKTAGTTGTTDIQIHNLTQATDMLTTKITIDSTETSSRTAATAPVIDTANDDVATGDIIRVDVDAVSTTPPVGLIVELVFGLP